ncbi:MAG: acyl-CoA synthetase (AMP-forming)/AMP-acid ligase [Ramlibacter sp.]|nr:acyl-CoA synthetase (AMP-forming)/AMP-acid ligase [Ramlibacter sp.]
MELALPATLGDMIEDNARQYPNDIAFICGDTRLTHRAFAARARQLASGLHKLGARRQDRIAILSQNRLEFNEVYGAGELAGYITATVNFRLAAPEIEWIVNDASPRIFVFEKEYLPLVQQLRPRLGSVEAFICIDGEADGVLSYEQVLASGDEAGPPFRARPEDIAYIIYTSGTTGRPKGCMLGQREERNTALMMNHSQRSAPGDVTLLMMPFFHVGAKHMANTQHIYGGTVVVQRGFDARAVLEAIQRERVTVALMAPIMVQGMLEYPKLAQYDLSSLHTIIYAAAPMPTPVLRQGLRQVGNVFVNMYGQTEISSTALMQSLHRPDGTEAERARLGSVGQPFLGTRIRIVDDAGRDCPQGMPGEILVRNEGHFRGYWNNTAATLETLRDGWVHSGDIGKLDDEGFLYLVDRKKDMIISGGENIYSREVEEALVQHPAVSEAAVVGVPDAKWGEAVCAVVVLRPAHDADESALIAHCRTLIASYKKPKFVVFAREIPKMPNGKTDKIQLRRAHASLGS